LINSVLLIFFLARIFIRPIRTGRSLLEATRFSFEKYKPVVQDMANYVASQFPLLRALPFYARRAQLRI